MSKQNKALKRKSDNNDLDNLNFKKLTLTLNIIIYARCSTKKQNNDSVTESLHGFQTQLNECNRYISKHNLDGSITLLEITKSGHLNPTELINLINSTSEKNNNKTIVIIASPDRLSRSPQKGMATLYSLLEQGIIVHAARHEIDSSSTGGLKEFNRYFFIAEEESNTFRDRFSTMRNLKLKNGCHIGRLQYGFKTVSDKNKVSGYPIKKKVPKKSETRKISLITYLYYGIKDIDVFNTLLNKVLNKKTDLNKVLCCKEDSRNGYFVTEVLDKSKTLGIKSKYNAYTEILYGYFRLNDIVKLLNDNNILYRNDKQWTVNSVRNIVKNNEKTYIDNEDDEDDEDDEDYVLEEEDDSDDEEEDDSDDSDDEAEEGEEGEEDVII